MSTVYIYDANHVYFQAVAASLHGAEVEVDILKTKEECDHVQFLITEKGGNQCGVKPLEMASTDIVPAGAISGGVVHKVVT